MLFMIFELGPYLESLWNGLPSEPIRCGVKEFFTIKIDFEVFGTKKEKSPYGASTLVWEKSPNGAPNCTKRTFLQNRNESHLLKTTPSGLFSRPEMKHLLDFSLFLKSAP